MSLKFGEVVKFGKFFQQETKGGQAFGPYENSDTFRKITVNSEDHYFQKEPINWLVINCFNNEYMLMAINILKVLKFGKNSNYMTSSIRRYLNDKFYNLAFSDEEKAIILKSSVKEEYTLPDPSKSDYVVLPSLTDITARLNWQLFSFSATPYAILTDQHNGWRNSILTRTTESTQVDLIMIAQSYSGLNFAQVRVTPACIATGILPILWIKDPSPEMLAKMKK